MCVFSIEPVLEKHSSVLTTIPPCTIHDPTPSHRLIGYFRLFIVATGCPSERRTQKTVIVVTGDSARIQDKTTESSAWFFNVLGVQHRHIRKTS